MFNLFKNFTLKWWQTGIFKLCVVCLGICIGATWPALFAPWRNELLLIVAATGIYLGALWWRQ